MVRFEVKQSANLNLTSYSGLPLISQFCQTAQVDAVIDPRALVSQRMRTSNSNVVKSTVGLINKDKSDFEVIEPFRGDRFLEEALGLSKVPGRIRMRQRLDARGAKLRALTDELSLRPRTEAPVTAHKAYLSCDIDTFVSDNAGTRKEAVSRTYQGVDGHTPIAAHLGNEGWNIGLELRLGKQHSACETLYFPERGFPRIDRLLAQRCPADTKILLPQDSGFDEANLLFIQAAEKDSLARRGRSFDFITKRNPRNQDKEAWIARTETAGGFAKTRPSKRVALLSQTAAGAWQCAKRDFRLVLQVSEHRIAMKGQHQLVAEIELQSRWTSLDIPSEEVIELNRQHSTHEQFHSEIKSDLDLERLPSGKFDTNDAIVHLVSFAHNCLRLLGRLGLTGEILPILHPAKRRLLKPVFLEIKYRAAKFVEHARRQVLDFGRNFAEHALCSWRCRLDCCTPCRRDDVLAPC